MFTRFGYFLGQALASVKHAPLLSLLPTSIIGATLLILGLYGAGLTNLESLARSWGHVATIRGAVTHNASETDRARLQQELLALDHVVAAQLVSPEQTLNRFRARGPQAASLVEGVDPSILPVTIELSLSSAIVSLDKVARISDKIVALPSVDEVDYGQHEFVQLQSLVSLLRTIGLIGGIVLALITAFIASNAIRLNVYARRDEIAILNLMGATGWFIRMPFLLEGAGWGILSGVVSTGLLWACQQLFALNLQVALESVFAGMPIQIFTPTIALAMTVAGIVLGVLGSALAVGRLMDQTAS